jgi:hypothetical protein
VAEAQIGRRIGRALGRAAEQETTRQLEAIVRDKVRCVFDDLECIRKAEASGKGAVLTDDDGTILVDDEGNPVTDPARAGEAARQGGSLQRPGEGAWANYDFVPGDELLLYEDFSRDRVGDFPRRFELVQGNFEVVEWQGGRYLRATSGGLVAIPLPGELPERFTVEFEVTLQHGNAYVRLMPAQAYYGQPRNYGGTVVSVERTRVGVRPAAAAGPTVLTPMGNNAIVEGLVPSRITADGGDEVSTRRRGRVLRSSRIWIAVLQFYGGFLRGHVGHHVGVGLGDRLWWGLPGRVRRIADDTRGNPVHASHHLD